MPLLLLPVVVLLLAALALLLWPIGLWQRYRHGRARRLVRPWMLALNAALLSVSLLLFLLGTWIGSRWIDAAWPNALWGLLAGIALGVAGVALTRLERGADAMHYTAPPWLVLALICLVALRALLGAWQAWHRWWLDAPAQLPWAWLEGYASLLAMAGLLLGYYAAYAWSLRWRVRRHARRLAMRLH